MRNVGACASQEGLQPVARQVVEHVFVMCAHPLANAELGVAPESGIAMLRDSRIGCRAGASFTPVAPGRVDDRHARRIWCSPAKLGCHGMLIHLHARVVVGPRVVLAMTSRKSLPAQPAAQLWLVLVVIVAMVGG